MRDAISEIKKNKPVYGLITKGGMACSAMYGILASCDKIYSEDKMNIVGSAGTMIQFDGKAANTEYKDNGVKHIRVYASKSTKKNKAFEEAVNNDNYELLINELLDPVNEEFLSNMEKDRPQLKGTDFNDGNTKFSKDSIGTFIDGIKSFDETFKELVFEAKNYKTKQSSNNINPKVKNAMTIDELKQQFPDTYNSIFNAGVQAEKDRVGTWMAHFETDSNKVKEGIKSGNPITATEREELLVKATANAHKAKIEGDSPKNVTTNETVETKEDDDEKEVKEFYKDI
jgi:ClpP class serine protease